MAQMVQLLNAIASNTTLKSFVLNKKVEEGTHSLTHVINVLFTTHTHTYVCICAEVVDAAATMFKSNTSLEIFGIGSKDFGDTLFARLCTGSRQIECVVVYTCRGSI